MKRRYILKEEFGDSPLDLPIEGPVVLEEPEPELKNIGVSQVFSDLIKNEWESIDKINSAIATLNDLGDNEELINNLKEILDVKMLTVGKLESSMLSIEGSSVEMIDNGKDETLSIEEPIVGEQDLLPEHEHDDSIIVEENNNKAKKLKEEFSYSGKGYEDYICYWMDEVASEIDYMIEEYDDDDETAYKLRHLTDEGIEELCNRVADDICNSDYLWEQINEHIHDGIEYAIQDVFEDNCKFETSTLEIGKKDEVEENPDEN